MLLLPKSKGHRSNAPYSGSPNHFQTKSNLHISEPDTLYQFLMADPVCQWIVLRILISFPVLHLIPLSIVGLSLEHGKGFDHKSSSQVNDNSQAYLTYLISVRFKLHTGPWLMPFLGLSKSAQNKSTALTLEHICSRVPNKRACLLKYIAMYPRVGHL